MFGPVGPILGRIIDIPHNLAYTPLAYKTQELYASPSGQSGEGGPGKGKAFFFEKKKQKTFDPSFSPPIRQKCEDEKFQKQKFFASFFQKRSAFFSM
jgi:hypothetical protein